MITSLHKSGPRGTRKCDTTFERGTSILRSKCPALRRRLCQRSIQSQTVPRSTVVIDGGVQVARSTSLDSPFIFAALPNFVPSFQFQLPSLPSALFYLLSNPFVTLSLAIFLYITVPRIWRAFVKYIIVPTAIVGTGIVVLRNPDTVRSAGSFITHFTSDHPYVTSGAILVGLGLLLSPYLLTALLALFLATGVPKLPAPFRNFLPSPVLEIEEQLSSFDSVVRGPIDELKSRAAQYGSGLSVKGGSVLSSAQKGLFQAQRQESTPGLSEANETSRQNR